MLVFWRSAQSTHTRAHQEEMDCKKKLDAPPLWIAVRDRGGGGGGGGEPRNAEQTSRVSKLFLTRFMEVSRQVRRGLFARFGVQCQRSAEFTGIRLHI